MAFNLGDIFVTIKAKTDDLQSGLNTAQKMVDNTKTGMDSLSNSSNNATNGLGKTAAIMGIAAGVAQNVFSRGIDMVTNSIGAAISRVDTLNNANRTFSNMGFSIGDTKNAMDGLKKSILGLPTPLDAAVRGMQTISSATQDVKKGQQIFTAINDAVLGFGGSAAMVDNAVVQMSQDFANGHISGQTWLSMMNSGLGPALNAIAKQMGITTSQLQQGLSDGTISVQKFQDSLIQMDKQGGGGLASFQKIAKDSTSGIGTGWDNMQTAITRGLAAIIQSIGSANISKSITAIGKFFEAALNDVATFVTTTIQFIKGAFDFYKDNKKTIENIAIVIIALLLPALIDFGIQSAISFGAYLLGVGLAVTETTVAGFEMAAAWLMALGPIGLIVAAVIAAVGLIIANWATVKIWLKDTWDWISNNWPLIAGILFGPIAFAVGLIITNFGIIKQYAYDAWQFIVSVWQAAPGFFSNLWQTTLNLVSQFFGNLPSTILNAVGDLGKLLYNAGKSVITGFVNGIKDTVGDIKSTLGHITDKLTSWKGPEDLDKKILFGSGKLVIGGFVNGLEDSFGTVRDSLKTLTGSIAPTATQSILNGGVSTLLGAQTTTNNTNARTVNNTTNINGPINVDSKQDADYLISRIDRNNQLENMGLSPA